MRLIRLLALFVCGTLLFVAFSAAQTVDLQPQGANNPQTQTEKPEIPARMLRSNAKLVILDVVVSHDGHPVRGMQQRAFHVFEDGQEQTLKVFEEHSPEAETSKVEKSPVPVANTYANFPESSPGSAINVLLLDNVNTPEADQAYARETMIEYLKNIPPGTRIAIFTLASRLRLVQGFTSDSAVLLSALNNSNNGPQQPAVLQEDTGDQPSDRAAQPEASQEVIDSLREFEADTEAYPKDQRVRITLDAMTQLGRYLGGLPGRKNVIWFSASFPLRMTPESNVDPFKSQRQYASQLEQVTDLLAAGRISLYPIDASRLIAPTTFGASRARVSGRSPTVSYTDRGIVHTRSMPATITSTSSNQQIIAVHATMEQLAEQTGGDPIYDISGLTPAIAKVVENGSSYYTLAYVPENKSSDGRFHKIQIKLSGHDYHLAYRRGYFAASPSAPAANEFLTAASAGMRRGVPSSSQILFHAQVLSANDPAARDLRPKSGPAGDLASKLKPPVQRYWIEYTADMRQINAELGPDGRYRSSLEFVAIVYDREGKLLNGARRAFNLSPPAAAYKEMLQAGFSARIELDLPSGDLFLRLAAHDLSTDHFGSIEVPFKIASMQASQLK